MKIRVMEIHDQREAKKAHKACKSAFTKKGKKYNKGKK